MRSNRESSRKGKKNSDKKQKKPQRGLGVAQLERIRIQEQIAAYSSMIPPSSSSSSSPSYGFYPFGYGYTQSSPTASWNSGGSRMLEAQQFWQSSMNGHFLSRHLVEDAQSKRGNKHLSHCNCKCNLLKAESSEEKELDLELRL